MLRIVFYYTYPYPLILLALIVIITKHTHTRPHARTPARTHARPPARKHTHTHTHARARARLQARTHTLNWDKHYLLGSVSVRLSKNLKRVDVRLQGTATVGHLEYPLYTANEGFTFWFGNCPEPGDFKYVICWARKEHRGWRVLTQSLALYQTLGDLKNWD